MMIPGILVVLIIVIIIAMAMLILILILLLRIALQLLKVGSRGHDDQSGRREYTTHQL